VYYTTNIKSFFLLCPTQYLNLYHNFSRITVNFIFNLFPVDMWIRPFSHRPLPLNVKTPTIFFREHLHFFQSFKKISSNTFIRVAICVKYIFKDKSNNRGDDSFHNLVIWGISTWICEEPIFFMVLQIIINKIRCQP